MLKTKINSNKQNPNKHVLGVKKKKTIKIIPLLANYVVVRGPDFWKAFFMSSHLEQKALMSTLLSWSVIENFSGSRMKVSFGEEVEKYKTKEEKGLIR